MVKGILTSLISIFVSVISAIIISEYPHQTPVLWLLLIQSLISMLFSFFTHCIKQKRIFFKLETKKYTLHLIRAIFGLLIYICYYKSLHIISPVVSSLLLNTAPLFVPILIYSLYGTKVSIKKLLALVVGFIGIFIILHPSISGTFSYYGYLLGIVSGLSFAVTLISVKQLSKTENVVTIVFLYNLHAFLIILIALIIFHPTINNDSLKICFFLGVLFCVKQYAISISVKELASSAVGILNYLVIILLIIYETIFKGYHISLIDYFGVFLVLIGAISTLLIFENSR